MNHLTSCCLAGFLICVGAVRVALGATTKAEVLAPTPADTTLKETEISTDGQHVGMLLTQPEGTELVVDGHVVARGKAIAAFALSSKGDHVAYIDVDGAHQIVFKDGQRVGIFDTVGSTWDPATLQLSMDGKHLAFIATRADKMFVVHDGKEGPQFTGVYNLTVSGDGLRTAYTAKKEGDGDLMRCVVDGDLSRPCKDVNKISFSSDGKTVAYMAQRDDDRWEENINGTVSRNSFSKITTPVIFSHDGKRSGYAGDIGPIPTRKLEAANAATVLDGTLERHNVSSITAIVFSDDGQHTIFIAENWWYPGSGNGNTIHKNDYLVVDGENRWEAERIDSAIISLDSKQLACAIRRYKLDPKENGFDTIVRLGDSVGKRYEKVGELVFSPDSKHLAYAAFANEKWLVVLDGVEFKDYEPLSSTDGKPVCAFDSNGKLNFIATRDGKIQRVQLTP